LTIDQRLHVPLERVLRAMGRLPAAQVRAAAIDHRVRRNRPRAASFPGRKPEDPRLRRLLGRDIITDGLTWWQIALRWFGDRWPR
jgi:hypothetical protein